MAGGVCECSVGVPGEGVERTPGEGSWPGALPGVGVDYLTLDSASIRSVCTGGRGAKAFGQTGGSVESI